MFKNLSPFNFIQFNREDTKNMVLDIVKDTNMLQKPCKTVFKKQWQQVMELIYDLEDTAEFHEDKNCVGLAANQIGSDLRVIVYKYEDSWIPMINPTIISHGKTLIDSEEGCLSLEGVRTTKRWKVVTVCYMDARKRVHTTSFMGFLAIVIQHEIDHLNGKLI